MSCMPFRTVAQLGEGLGRPDQAVRQNCTDLGYLFSESRNQGGSVTGESSKHQPYIACVVEHVCWLC